MAARKKQDAGRELSIDGLEEVFASFAEDRARVVAKNAVSSMGVRRAARVPEGLAENTLGFDVELKQGARCDQERSGRCWMFAALNTMRQQVIERYKLDNFEFSQAWTLFFDKLEKSNWFFEQILDTLDEPLDSREMAFILAGPVDDGGQWDMLAALVEKYGLVPKEAYPETACSKNTYQIDAYLTRYLRKCARDLREAHEEGATAEELRAMKKGYMANVQHMLVMAFGQPPREFDVRLRDRDAKLVVSGRFTPKKFARKVLRMHPGDYVSLISAPTADKPYMRPYTVRRLGNVVEAGGVRHLNLPVERLKELALAQLKDGRPVWFGCDVDQSYLQDEGVMDTAALDADALFGFEVEGGFDRAARLDYGESFMTHAMTFLGARLDADGAPVSWKVENSWGKDHGRDGFDTMSDEWFSEYVYQVVVDKKYLKPEERKAYREGEAIELAPWDPFGTLA